MIAILIVLGSLVAYFGIGFLSCKYTVPSAIQREYDIHKNSYHYLTEEDHRRWAIDWGGKPWRHGTIWGWWITIPWTIIINRHLFSTEAFAPWAKDAEIAAREKRLAEREAEIAKLERELGIGDRP